MRHSTMLELCRVHLAEVERQDVFPCSDQGCTCFLQPSSVEESLPLSSGSSRYSDRVPMRTPAEDNSQSPRPVFALRKQLRTDAATMPPLFRNRV